MDRYVRSNGDVAVLYSPGYGAGWSTWAHKHEEDVVFDPELVALVLADRNDEAGNLAETKYGIYTGGAEDLTVMWLPPGTRFTIEEYDGSESVRLHDKVDVFTA